MFLVCCVCVMMMMGIRSQKKMEFGILKQLKQEVVVSGDFDYLSHKREKSEKPDTL